MMRSNSSGAGRTARRRVPLPFAVIRSAAALALLGACAAPQTAQQAAPQGGAQFMSTPLGQCVAAMPEAPAEPERRDCSKGAILRIGSLKIDSRKACRDQAAQEAKDYAEARAAYRRLTAQLAPSQCLDRTRVATLQTDLRDAGFYRGLVDGVAGQGAADALLAFHAAQGAAAGGQGPGFTRGYAAKVAGVAEEARERERMKDPKYAAAKRAEQERREAIYRAGMAAFAAGLTGSGGGGSGAVNSPSGYTCDLFVTPDGRTVRKCR